MLIDDTTLPSMAAADRFRQHFETHTREEANKALLTPVLSIPRMKDAHYAWRDDMQRLEDRERKLSDGADHFKQCANLAYWLRRMSPIIDYVDFAKEVEDIDDLYQDEKDRRELLNKYGTEFMAFDFGFQICQYYEMEKIDNPLHEPPALSGEYIHDVCYMMKFKHVSPHSLFLVYKSIFV